jgi:hypothetical protein
VNLTVLFETSTQYSGCEDEVREVRSRLSSDEVKNVEEARRRRM